MLAARYQQIASGGTMRAFLGSAAALALSAAIAQAQGAPSADNLDKLSNFKTTGTTEFVRVEQTGAFADGIRANLERITLPEGFHIGLYAVVPDKRRSWLSIHQIALRMAGSIYPNQKFVHPIHAKYPLLAIPG
jgi:hypothetical protein